MKKGYLQKLRSLDPQAFAAFMRHLGFAAAACYRRRGDTWTLILSGEAEGAWPAAMAYSLHYTPDSDEAAQLGWLAAKTATGARADWPKSANLYFPEQELDSDELFFAVLAAPGKRLRGGEPSGALEAFASRLKALLRASDERQSLTDLGLTEHIKSLGIDLHMLLDHELRTPLQSVSGYASLLKDIDPKDTAHGEYWKIVDGELERALEAIGKLSLALPGGVATLGVESPREPFDAAEEARLIAEDAREKAGSIIGDEPAKRLSVKFNKNSDTECYLMADRRLFRWALWEVLKNAVVHARHGKVEVAVYALGHMLVVDVVDDGPGVAPGAEELVFLRFYQEPTAAARRARRGLGLGLYLARHIAERHLGQLTYVRGRTGSVFRFLWPLAQAAWREGA